MCRSVSGASLFTCSSDLSAGLEGCCAGSYVVSFWTCSCTYFKDISPDIFSDSLVSVVLLAVSYLFPVVDSVPDCLVQRVLKPAPALGVSMFTYA